MKTLGLFFLLLSFSCSVYGQADSVYINELKSECGTEDVSSTFPVFPVEHDTLRILVVFAKFPNDTWDPDPPGQATYYWPGSSSSLPSWATSMIDQDGINIAPNTLTALSRDMSLGRFIVIGDVYPNLFIYPHTSTYYKDSTSGHMGLAIKDLLQGIDANVDYSQYDKFTIGTTSNPRQPDGIVDFILVINRFHLTVDGFNYSGYAALGGSTNS